MKPAQRGNHASSGYETSPKAEETPDMVEVRRLGQVTQAIFKSLESLFSEA